MDEEIVTAVLKDWRSAPVAPRLRAVLAVIETLTTTPEALGPSDIEAARSAGLSDAAIYEAAYVVFLFSVMDRLADAFDFSIPERHQVDATGRFLHTHGYKLVNLIR